MQNAQIWKSIEAICNEEESAIKNVETEITVIQSIAAPALAHQRTSNTNTVALLSSEPAPPKAKIGNRSTPQENVVDNPLSPATMAEIAAAIDRASQTAQKPQIIDQPLQPMSDQLRKDLMIEVSLAIRSVLANELPKMVRHSISESLYELINPKADPTANNLGALETRPQSRDGKNKVEPIKSMPGVNRYSLDKLDIIMRKVQKYSIPMIALFPYISKNKKDKFGTEALNKNNLICKSIRLIKKNLKVVKRKCWWL